MKRSIVMTDVDVLSTLAVGVEGDRAVSIGPQNPYAVGRQRGNQLRRGVTVDVVPGYAGKARGRQRHRPPLKPTAIHKIGGATERAAAAAQTSWTGFAPQRGAIATLRKPSSKTTSSFAIS